VQQSVVSGRRSRSSKFVCGGFVYVLVCLFVWLFFSACGDTRPQGRRNWKTCKLQVSFFFLSRKHNTRLIERAGPKTDRLKIRKNFRLPEVHARTWRASVLGLSKTATFFVWTFFLAFFLIFFLFLPPEVTSDRFIYLWGGFRFASIVCFFFLRIRRSLGLFIGDGRLHRSLGLFIGDGHASFLSLILHQNAPSPTSYDLRDRDGGGEGIWGVYIRYLLVCFPRCLPSSILFYLLFFIFCNESIWLAHH